MFIKAQIYQWITEGIAILFIILFTYAAVSKLIDFETFRIQLGQSPFLSPYAWLLAWGIPLIEIIVALMFFSSKLRLVALYASLLLMILFTVYITSVLFFADSIPCSCGGVLASLSWNEHLVFNLVFIFLAGLEILIKKSEHKEIKHHFSRFKAGIG